jgi:hypothetical protein
MSTRACRYGRDHSSVACTHAASCNRGTQKLTGRHWRCVHARMVHAVYTVLALHAGTPAHGQAKQAPRGTMIRQLAGKVPPYLVRKHALATHDHQDVARHCPGVLQAALIPNTAILGAGHDQPAHDGRTVRWDQRPEFGRQELKGLHGMQTPSWKRRCGWEWGGEGREREKRERHTHAHTHTHTKASPQAGHCD